MTQPMTLVEKPMAARRTLLATTPNPGARQDYMVMLQGAFAVGWTDHPVWATLKAHLTAIPGRIVSDFSINSFSILVNSRINN